MPSRSSIGDLPKGSKAPQNKKHPTAPPRRKNGPPPPPQRHRNAPPQMRRKGPPPRHPMDSCRIEGVDVENINATKPDTKQKEEIVERPKGKVISNSFVPNEDNAPVEIKREYEKMEMDLKPHMVSRALFVSAVLCIIGTLMEFMKIKIWLLPSFLEFDFSIFPEYLALIFYGPAISIGIILLKNFAHMMIFYLLHGSISYVGELSNVLTDIIFVMVAFVLFSLLVNGKPMSIVRGKLKISTMLKAGTLSSIVTAVVLMPIMKFIIYPLFKVFFNAKGYEFDILTFYAEKLPSITNVWQGLVIYNLPFEFCKLMLVTLIATGVYALIKRKK